MKALRHLGSCPAPVATLPPRTSFPTLTFSVARTLTFSKARPLTFSVAIDTCAGRLAHSVLRGVVGSGLIPSRAAARAIRSPVPGGQATATLSVSRIGRVLPLSENVTPGQDRMNAPVLAPLAAVLPEEGGRTPPHVAKVLEAASEAHAPATRRASLAGRRIQGRRVGPDHRSPIQDRSEGRGRRPVRRSGRREGAPQDQGPDR